jgi:hypothetical protein
VGWKITDDTTSLARHAIADTSSGSVIS